MKKSNLGLLAAIAFVGISTANAAPELKGSLTNKNTNQGPAQYAFASHPKNVFVFHHMGVEVC